MNGSVLSPGEAAVIAGSLGAVQLLMETVSRYLYQSQVLDPVAGAVGALIEYGSCEMGNILFVAIDLARGVIFLTFVSWGPWQRRMRKPSTQLLRRRFWQSFENMRDVTSTSPVCFPQVWSFADNFVCACLLSGCITFLRTMVCSADCDAVFRIPRHMMKRAFQ